MCGIAGIINLDHNIKTSYSQIIDMCDVQRHRGPDGEGYLYSNDFSFENFEYLKNRRPKAHIHIAQSRRRVMLGHRRLSIIDLSDNAFQPMPDNDEKVWVVYNGEIYNHYEIRKELVSLGYNFNTNHSDTEVLINAYKEWGVDCLQHFRGMFAFVLWDIEKDLFFVVRDRLGVKPLFYSLNNGQFYFSSEIKGILQNKECERKINYHALNEYLTFSSVAAPNTMYKGIYKIKPAHYLLITNGEISAQKQYWDLAEIATHKLKLNEHETSELLLEKLIDSVNVRREGDVPYGALLSGGVDSSANVAILSKLISNELETFTVGFKNVENVYTNEFEYAEKVAKQFNTKHNQICLDDNYFYDFLEKMSIHIDEPLADTACIPIYYVAQLARQHNIKILLGGEGSDELFIGYQLWRFNYDFNNLIGTKNNKFLIAATKRILKLPYIKNKRVFYKDWLNKISKYQTSFWGGTVVLDEDKKKKIFSESFKAKTLEFDVYKNIELLFTKFTNAGNTDFLDWMTYLDTNIRLPELLLSRLDRMTMAASVEAREPFMDYRLAEFAMQIDSSLKIKNRTEKYILKKSLEGILDPEIIYREKDGFTVPLNQIFANEKFRKFASTKINDFNDYENIFTPGYLHSIFENNKYSEIWQLMNLALWWENYIIGTSHYINEEGNIKPSFTN